MNIQEIAKYLMIALTVLGTISGANNIGKQSKPRTPQVWALSALISWTLILLAFGYIK